MRIWIWLARAGLAALIAVGIAAMVKTRRSNGDAPAPVSNYVPLPMVPVRPITTLPPLEQPTPVAPAVPVPATASATPAPPAKPKAAKSKATKHHFVRKSQGSPNATTGLPMFDQLFGAPAAPSEARSARKTSP